MQGYKCLCAAVMIYYTVANIQTHTQTHKHTHTSTHETAFDKIAKLCRVTRYSLAILSLYPIRVLWVSAPIGCQSGVMSLSYVVPLPEMDSRPPLHLRPLPCFAPRKGPRANREKFTQEVIAVHLFFPFYTDNKCPKL